ncbi:hypothetical protein [Streptomyces sp. OE57]|uniref:hypothetical protein n=1 Tax=Streptomyces lacaronensis TaxID=3379885 RepID=UPI0039B7770B
MNRVALDTPAASAMRASEVPLRVVERADIGVAQAGGLDDDDDLARPRVRVRYLFQSQRLAGSVESP